MYIFRWKQPSIDLQKATEIQVPVASTVQHPTGVVLTGKGAANYGSVQQQNILRLLENFADSQPPVGPTVGQLWFDSVHKSLKMCISTSPITWANASGVSVGNAPPEPQLGALWYQTMGEAAGILHVYNGLGRYGSAYDNVIGGWNQVWPQVQTIAGREEYDTMRELLEQLAGQAVSSYGSGAIGRYIQDLTDFASLDSSLRQAWASKGADDFALLTKTTDLTIPRQAINNGSLFALADAASPNDNYICGLVNGIPTPGQSGFITLPNGAQTTVAAGSLGSNLNFDFAYVIWNPSNIGGLGVFNFGKFENQSWYIDPATSGSNWTQFTPAAGQYIIGTAATHQADNNQIYPGMKNIVLWGNAVEIVNPSLGNLKVETNSQDWDKLLAAVRYAISRLDVSDTVVRQVSKMPFVRDGWQIPATLAVLQPTDIRFPSIERRANQWPSIVGQLSGYQDTQSAVTAALPVRHLLKGMSNGGLKPEIAIETLTPTLSQTFASGIGRLRVAINFGSFDDRCRFLFSGGALQLELAHVGGASAADNSIRTLLSNNASMVRFNADRTMLFSGTAPYAPAGAGNSVGLQNANSAGKLMFTKSLGGASVSSTVFRPDDSGRLELQVDINANGPLAGSTQFKINVVRDTTLYNGSLAVYPGPQAYSAADLLILQQIDIAPTITSNPSSATVTEGEVASFTVVASGTQPLTYTWQYNQGNGWLALGAPNSQTLSFATQLLQSGYSYRAVVSNAAGSATSSAAILTVEEAGEAPTIVLQPSNAAVVEGQTASFTVQAAGTEPLNYQWRKNDSNISGATAATYSFVPTLADNGTTYSVRVTNNFGNVTSSTVTLSVTQATQGVSITSQPIDRTINEGNPVSFVVAASGTAPISYQWYKNGTAISGATNATYTHTATVDENGATYYVIVDNDYGPAVQSNTVTLTVSQTNFGASITSQPSNVSVLENDTATFSVAASGTAPISYQWYKNGTAISGATNATYTYSAPLADNSATFYVIVDNDYGPAVQSNTVTLTVQQQIVAPTSVNISVLGASGSLLSGTLVTLQSSVLPINTTSPTYQWRKNGTNIPGATSSSYSFTALIENNSDVYSLVVANTAGSVTSNNISVVVGNAPTITAQPTAQSAISGQSLTFNVTATGATSYQWQYSQDGTNWTDVT